MKQYKLIRNYNGAEKGSIFTYDDELNVYEYEEEKITDNGISSIHLAYSPEVMDILEENEFVIAVEDEDDVEAITVERYKLEKLQKKIDGLIETYETDYEQLMKEYEEGNVQTCVKVEAETVYHNLVKVLNALKDIVNE